MKVTVTEALRLKNEISTMVSALQSSIGASEYGITYEGDKLVTDEDREKFQDVYDQLSKILVISQGINSVLAKYDVESSVSDLVRESKNKELLIRVLTQALQYKDNTSTSYQVVGNKRVEVKTHFIPHLSSKEIKLRITSLKKALRDIKSQIDKKNAATVELSFEYEDLEGF